MGTYEHLASAAVGTGLSNYTIDYHKGTLTVVMAPPGIMVLDPKVSGALTLSGNASVNTATDVVVESTSSIAISLSGNARLTASDILLAGGIRTSGNSTYAGNLTNVSGLGIPSPIWLHRRLAGRGFQ